MTDTATVPAIGPPAGLAFRKFRDRIVEGFLLAAALVAVFTTLAIVVVLVRESLPFFEHVSRREFLSDTLWTPLFGEARYGFLPLVAGTLGKAIPERLVGDLKGASNITTLSGIHPGRTRDFLFAEFPAGGTGATLPIESSGDS